jgi:hypothetical protein
MEESFAPAIERGYILRLAILYYIKIRDIRLKLNWAGAAVALHA